MSFAGAATRKTAKSRSRELWNRSGASPESPDGVREDQGAARAFTPPKRASTEDIALSAFMSVLPTRGPQDEQQTLIEPPQLPPARRSPRRTRGAAEREPGARHQEPQPGSRSDPGLVPGTTAIPPFEADGEQAADKVAELFTSLEIMQTLRPTALRRIFGHIIDPQSPRKRAWDLFVLLLVVFSTLYEPYTAAFRPTHTQMVWWEWIVDL